MQFLRRGRRSYLTTRPVGRTILTRRQHGEESGQEVGEEELGPQVHEEGHQEEREARWRQEGHEEEREEVVAPLGQRRRTQYEGAGQLPAPCVSPYCSTA